MPHLHILTWPINSDEKAKKLLEGITSVVHNTLGSPLDIANKSRLKEIKDNHHEANKK